MNMNCLMSFISKLVKKTNLNLLKASPSFQKFLSVQPANIFLSGMYMSIEQHVCAQGWGLINSTNEFWNIRGHVYKKDPSSIGLDDRSIDR